MTTCSAAVWLRERVRDVTATRCSALRRADRHRLLRGCGVRRCPGLDSPIMTFLPARSMQPRRAGAVRRRRAAWHRPAYPINLKLHRRVVLLPFKTDLSSTCSTARSWRGGPSRSTPGNENWESATAGVWAPGAVLLSAKSGRSSHTQYTRRPRRLDNHTALLFLVHTRTSSTASLLFGRRASGLAVARNTRDHPDGHVLCSLIGRRWILRYGGFIC
jgi:hypothetical protein